jgi:hypothetical protein
VSRRELRLLSEPSTGPARAHWLARLRLSALFIHGQARSRFPNRRARAAALTHRRLSPVDAPRQPLDAFELLGPEQSPGELAPLELVALALEHKPPSSGRCPARLARPDQAQREGERRVQALAPVSGDRQERRGMPWLCDRPHPGAQARGARRAGRHAVADERPRRRRRTRSNDARATGRRRLRRERRTCGTVPAQPHGRSPARNPMDDRPPATPWTIARRRPSLTAERKKRQQRRLYCSSG